MKYINFCYVFIIKNHKVNENIWALLETFSTKTKILYFTERTTDYLAIKLPGI